MSDSLTTIYHGTVVTYDERRNRWAFILRGREKSSESLALAKEAIDKPAPKEVKPFEKRQAWYVRYSSEPEEVTVTSLAEGGCREKEFWVKTGQHRSKVAASDLFEKSESNDLIVTEMNACSKAVEKLEEKRRVARNTLFKFISPEPEP